MTTATTNAGELELAGWSRQVAELYAAGDRQGLIKIVGDTTNGELLGGHVVAGRATELVQELADVSALQGGYSQIARSIHVHPRPPRPSWNEVMTGCPTR